MTMKELAQLAGVSSAAISRYLNGGSLSAEKREVIRAAIEQTGYRPDAAAQALRTRTTDLVGLIVPKLDSESVSRLAAGAMNVLAREGYLCQIAVSQNDPERELSCLRLLEQRQVAGAILMATTSTPSYEDTLRKIAIPVVVTGQKFRHVPCVYHDDRGAAAELTRLVLARGRRQLAYIGVTEQDAAVGQGRRRGVEDAMREAGLDPAQLHFELSSFHVDGGRIAMERLLASHPELDAVICATDSIAFGAIQALRAAGRRLPEDVSVAGMGDSWASEHITPHLTTAHFYYKTSGETAAELLLDVMRRRRNPGPVRQTMLSYAICRRDSV